MLKDLSWALITLSLMAVPGLAEEAGSSEIDAQDDCVILLHGFRSDPSEMAALEAAISARGYKTVNDGYPSTEAGIEVLAQQYVPPMVEKCGAAQSIGFVTHSMGGLLMRRYLYTNMLPNIGRAVMLAPPNHGSEVADELAQLWISKQLDIQSLSDLQTAEIATLPLASDFEFDVGIIAGSSSVNPIGSYFLPGPDDGYVALENAKLEGMKDFYIVPTSHGLITNNDTVISQTLYFLDHGYFDHSITPEGYWFSTDSFEGFACQFVKNAKFCEEE